MIICIEGIDAAGKATQTRLLSERMASDLISFPVYETASGEVIHGHLKQKWSAVYTPTTVRENQDAGRAPEPLLDAMVFQALMLMNKAEFAKRIATAKRDGKHMVLDRYWPSAYAYGKNDGLSPDFLLNIHEGVLPEADLHILLDLSVEESFARRPIRRDRYETQAGFLQTIRQNYRELWEKMGHPHSSRWAIVNAEQEQSKVASDIFAAIVKCREAMWRSGE